MSKEFQFNRLKKWKVGGTRDKMELSIPLPKTPSGMVLQRCPSETCTPRMFRIGVPATTPTLTDEQLRITRRVPRTKYTTCPYCGHDDEDGAFVSELDHKAIVRLAEWAAMQDVTDHFSEIARRINSSFGSGGLISMKMQITPSHRPRPYFRREDLLRRLTCDICSRPYGVFALALFCPDCGARNLHVHFAREVDIVHRQLTIAEAQAGIDEEIAYRLLSNAHEDVLTALEAYLKTIFLFSARRRLSGEQLDQALKMVQNTFQNIAKARMRYALLNLDPFGVLDETEFDALTKNVSKRHIIGHNLGIADLNYVSQGGTEPPGETVHLLADDVKHFGVLCQKVVIHVEESIPELLPPRPPPEPTSEGSRGVLPDSPSDEQKA